MTHDEFKSMVNNRGKRRLIKALDKARVDRGDKIKLFQGFVKLQHNDGDTLNLLNHMALKYGFPSVTKSESPRLRPIPLPFLGQPGVCCHCGKELPKRRRKWCSDDCQINYDRLRGFSYRYATIEENLKKFKVLTCEKCLKPIEFETDAIADHILPLAEGGDHNVSNLQILCSVCNTEKTRADLSKIVLRRARGKSEAHRAKNSTLDAFLSL